MKARALREQVVELCLELSRLGYFSGTGGNLAIRVDPEHIVVTPSATDYFAMGPQDVAIVRLSDLKQIDGDKVPSVETSLHSMVLKKRPDAHYSIHTHQPVASACSLLGKPLTIDEPSWWQEMGKIVPIVGYAPSGSSWLANKLIKGVRPGINAYLMLNHGALCCGPDQAATLRSIQRLEHVARLHLERRIVELQRTDARQATALSRVLSTLSDTTSPLHG